MANAKLIDRINDAFISVLVQENSKQYSEYIKAVNREMIDNVENLTADKVKQILSKQDLNIDNIALLFTIQNSIILILEDRKRAKKNKSLLPAIALLGMYSLSNPKRLARKVIKISKGIGLNNREKQAQAIIKDFENSNRKVLKSARRQAIKNLNKSISKSKISKRILRDYKQGLKDNKSIASIKRSLVRKYNNLSNIDRALDTELHAQSEFVRQEHSIAIGYTHKTWKTQGDERVRHTRWHDQVNNKRIPIESDFRAAGLKAQRPGDERLPPSERIRCRCYLVYD